MAIRKQDLREAYNKSISQGPNVREVADNFAGYTVGMLLLSGIISAVLINFLGVTGVVIGALAQLAIIYIIIKRLFEKVDELVADRISCREKELLDSIEEDSPPDDHENN